MSRRSVTKLLMKILKLFEKISRGENRHGFKLTVEGREVALGINDG